MEKKFRVWDDRLKCYIKEVEGFHIIGEVMMFNLIEDYCSKNMAGAETTCHRLCDLEEEQYIGRKDINDKDIYEGDIVKVIHSGFEGEVIFNIDFLQWSAYNEKKNIFLYLNSYQELEIIGNKRIK